MRNFDQSGVMCLGKTVHYEPDAGTPEEIIATIKKCPSGALTYLLNGTHEKNYFQDTRIVVEKDGPLHCQGGIELKDDQVSDPASRCRSLYALPLRGVEEEAVVRRLP